MKENYFPSLCFRRLKCGNMLLWSTGSLKIIEKGIKSPWRLSIKEKRPNYSLYLGADVIEPSGVLGWAVRTHGGRKTREPNLCFQKCCKGVLSKCITGKPKVLSGIGHHLPIALSFPYTHGVSWNCSLM